MKILRLLLFEECNRRCAGCCNKQWDLSKLPVCQSFEGYDQVLLTGGEPMLHPDVVIEVAKKVPRGIPVYLYTADVQSWQMLDVLRIVDGLTVTLHSQGDVRPFIAFKRRLENAGEGEASFWDKSLRLNVFKGVQLPVLTYDMWKIKSDIVWLPNCPLPKNEVFMRLEAPNVSSV